MTLAPETQALIKAALKEDLAKAGDLTTKYFVPKGAELSGRVVVKGEGVIAGLHVAAAVFKAVSPRITAKVMTSDGARVAKGKEVMRVSGGREILTAERTALNFLQHLSGVATLTRKFVDAVAGTRAKIMDTRKTLPGWRALDKYAVVCGGGRNHRMGLYDAVLLKDNHWSMCKDVPAAARDFRKKHPKTPLQIEAADLAQVERALAAGADMILLDNMGEAGLRECIARIRAEDPTIEIEVSGMVSLDTVRSLAELGPDRISIGRITHSAPALDISLEIP